MAFTRRNFLGMIASAPVAAVAIYGPSLHRRFVGTPMQIGLLGTDLRLPVEADTPAVTFTAVAGGKRIDGYVVYDARTGKPLCGYTFPEGQPLLSNGGDITLNFEAGSCLSFT